MYTYKTRGTCSAYIHYDIVDGKIHNVSFDGGCNGNLKAIGKLVEGQDARHIIDLLKGNQCGTKGTSCADQLARALEMTLQEQKTGTR